MLNTFISKKVEVVAPMSASSFAVIFNMPNHESLVAASLLQKVLGAERHVVLSDIRDTVPEAETYIWIGVGTKEDLVPYFGTQVSKKEFDTVMRNSIFLNRTGEVDVLVIQDGLVHQAADKAELAGVDSGAMRKWCLPSMSFHDSALASDASARYYRLLEMCYRNYYGDDVTPEELLSLGIDGTEDEAKALMAQQKAVNKVLGKKVRAYSFGETGLMQINTLGPDVHSLLRRLGMSGKDFLHVSMGSYGVVVYTNTDRQLKDFRELSSLKILEE